MKKPLSRFEIEHFKHAGDRFAGEKRQEQIALAALQYFELKEIYGIRRNW